MSSYNRKVGKIAGDLQSHNMQTYMKNLSSEPSDEHKRILDSFDQYEYDTFVDLIFNTAFDRYNHFSDGQRVKKCYENNSEMFQEVYRTANEESLNDPKFSEALNNNSLYSRNMGHIMSHVTYYPKNKIGFSVTRDVSMDILFLPTMSGDTPNAIRFDIKENMEEDEYPYINYSVDLLDTGEIVYNQPYKVTKEGMTPVDINEAHLKVSNGINIVRDIFMDIFTKADIKEEGSQK